MIRKGQKLVCIASPNGRWRCPKSGLRVEGPHKLDVVTVAKACYRPAVTSLWFVEWDGYFNAKWFRPLVERTQEEDVTVFLPLLYTVPHREDAI